MWNNGSIPPNFNPSATGFIRGEGHYNNNRPPAQQRPYPAPWQTMPPVQIIGPMHPQQTFQPHFQPQPQFQPPQFQPQPQPQFQPMQPGPNTIQITAVRVSNAVGGFAFLNVQRGPAAAAMPVMPPTPPRPPAQPNPPLQMPQNRAPNYYMQPLPPSINPIPHSRQNYSGPAPMRIVEEADKKELAAKGYSQSPGYAAGCKPQPSSSASASAAAAAAATPLPPQRPVQQPHPTVVAKPLPKSVREIFALLAAPEKIELGLHSALALQACELERSLATAHCYSKTLKRSNHPGYIANLEEILGKPTLISMHLERLYGPPPAGTPDPIYNRDQVRCDLAEAYSDSVPNLPYGERGARLEQAKSVLGGLEKMERAASIIRRIDDAIDRLYRPPSPLFDAGTTKSTPIVID